jgi:CBS domain-containing protein
MVSDKTTAPRLFDEGQGPWLDTITRAMLLDGVFQTLLDRDIVGMTRTPRSVPTAIDGADADDGERQRLVSEGTSAGVAAPVPAPPVGAGGARLVGMLVGRDSVTRARAGLDPKTVTVAEMMTVEPIHGWEDQDVARALALMRARKISDLAVLSRDGEIVGRFLGSPLWSSSAGDPGDREDGADGGPRPWL